MSYNVFLAAYIGGARDHHAIFVETEANGAGYIFQVTGDIQNGMKYECKAGKKPETSASFSSKTYLGVIAVTDWNRIGEVCSGIPPPKKQFQGAKRLFPKEPLRRCQDWTQEAIQALTGASVLQPPANTAPDSAVEYWTWSEEYNRYFHDNGDGTYEWASEQPSSSSKGKGRAG
jgi:hypothetical protein